MRRQLKIGLWQRLFLGALPKLLEACTIIAAVVQNELYTRFIGYPPGHL